MSNQLYLSQEVLPSVGWGSEPVLGLMDNGVDLFYKDAHGVQPRKEPSLIEIIYRIKNYFFDLPVCDWLTGKREPLQDLIDEANYVGVQCYIPLKAGRAYTVTDALDPKGLELRAWRDSGQVAATDDIWVQKVSVDNYALKLGDSRVMTSGERINLAYIKLRSDSTPGQFTITGDGAFRGVVFDLEPGMQLETVAGKLDFTDVYIQVRAEDSELNPDTGFAQKRRPLENLGSADSYARGEGISSAPVDAGETNGNGQSGEVTTDGGSGGGQMPSGSGGSGEGGASGGASGGSGGEDKRPDDNKDKVKPAEEGEGKKRKDKDKKKQKRSTLGSFRHFFGAGKHKKGSSDSQHRIEEKASSEQSGAGPGGAAVGAVGGDSGKLAGMTQMQDGVDGEEERQGQLASSSWLENAELAQLRDRIDGIESSVDQLDERHSVLENQVREQNHGLGRLNTDGVNVRQPYYFVDSKRYEVLRDAEEAIQASGTATIVDTQVFTRMQEELQRLRLAKNRQRGQEDMRSAQAVNTVQGEEKTVDPEQAPAVGSGSGSSAQEEDDQAQEEEKTVDPEQASAVGSASGSSAQEEDDQAQEEEKTVDPEQAPAIGSGSGTSTREEEDQAQEEEKIEDREQVLAVESGSGTSTREEEDQAQEEEKIEDREQAPGVESGSVSSTQEEEDHRGGS